MALSWVHILDETKDWVLETEISLFPQVFAFQTASIDQSTKLV